MITPSMVIPFHCLFGCKEDRGDVAEVLKFKNRVARACLYPASPVVVCSHAAAQNAYCSQLWLTYVSRACGMLSL